MQHILIFPGSSKIGEKSKANYITVSVLDRNMYM